MRNFLRKNLRGMKKSLHLHPQQRKRGCDATKSSLQKNTKRFAGFKNLPYLCSPLRFKNGRDLERQSDFFLTEKGEIKVL